jgi:hypothetical protein
MNPGVFSWPASRDTYLSEANSNRRAQQSICFVCEALWHPFRQTLPVKAVWTRFLQWCKSCPPDAFLRTARRLASAFVVLF